MTYAWRVVAVIATGFVALSLPPYLRGDTRVPPTFDGHYPMLVAHVLLGSVAMVAAVHQIWPGRRLRHPAVHRVVGRVYMGTAIPAALCALVLGAATPFGPVLAVSNVVLAAVWLYFTTAGWVGVRRRDIAAHRFNMALSVTAALSIITNRVWNPVLFVALQPLQATLFGGSEEDFLHMVAGLGGWLGWTVPVATVYFWLKSRPVGVISGHDRGFQRQDRARHP
ncbi:DUF2306 domain-containing protein [Mycobacterium sp. SMC-4]|uniref:DUF2306 domain-containing protein n=1 Tax=Mycobacterium sp. SMC-4 TaxID=2857059 RepID=UPI003D059C4F